MHQKKRDWAILVAACIGSIAISGCSGDDPVDNGGSAGSPGTAGSSGTAGTGGSSAMVPPVVGASAYVILTDAMPSTSPTPAKYASACTACHQDKGQGFAQLAPETRHVPPAFATAVIRNGRKEVVNGMPTAMVPFPLVSTGPTSTALTDAEVAEIVAWLNSGPKPTTPEGLYKDFCGNCHGNMNGDGGSVGIKIQGATAAKVDMVVRAGVGTDINMRRAYMPAFDATLLTDAELAMIKTHIGAL